MKWHCCKTDPPPLEWDGSGRSKIYLIWCRGSNFRLGQMVKSDPPYVGVYWAVDGFELSPILWAELTPPTKDEIRNAKNTGGKGS